MAEMFAGTPEGFYCGPWQVKPEAPTEGFPVQSGSPKALIQDQRPLDLQERRPPGGA